MVLGAGERRMRIAARRNAQMRGRVGQRKRHALTFAHGELGDGLHVLAAQLDRRAQHRGVRANDRLDAAVVLQAIDPRNRKTVIEAQHQFHLHAHRAAFADDDPHHLRPAVARRHEIDQRDRAFGRFEIGFKDQRFAAITARNFWRCIRDRRNQPAAVVGRAEQGGEAGAGVEARPAEPVDRTVEGDERGRVAVADQRIVFDECGHGGTRRFYAGRRSPRLGLLLLPDSRYALWFSTQWG